MRTLSDWLNTDIAVALPLVGRDYAYTVPRLIDAAAERVSITIYQSSYTPGKPTKPDLIINALLRAQARGVKVKALINFTGAASNTKTNNSLAQCLIENKVAVRAARSGYLVHGKVVIIDTECSVLGSHNLTQRGLWHNYEASVAVHNTPVAESLEAWFDWLWNVCGEVDPVG